MEILTQAAMADFEGESLPKEESSNFLYSFAILPKYEKRAIHSIYAFCSYVDNIVDAGPSRTDSDLKRKLERLDFWESQIEKIYRHLEISKKQKQKNKSFSNKNINTKGGLGVLLPLGEVIDRFSIPRQYFLTLIDGVRRDLVQNRYETFEELKDYCYGVASIVGLISIEVFGYKYEETKEYAVNLGYALQLTNIMRDIKTDKDRGYIYIPLEDLRRFNYSEADLTAEVYNENFVEMMRFQAKRAREYYHRARTSLRPDERPSIVAAEIMDTIYYRLLEKIELNEFDVFRKRVRVSGFHKLLTALKRWLDIKMFIRRIKK